jgi:dihydroorotate dehydrogenase electron transfer subunit
MHTGFGRLIEVILADGCRYGRVTCPEKLIPTPGQYLLASDGSDSPLPVSIFYTDSAPQGFTTLVPESWSPGQELVLRGPLGRGFSLPATARKIGLIAFDDPPSHLRGLIQPALKQSASVVLVCDQGVDDLSDEVEVQPLSQLDDILAWADYLALDVDRENLNELKQKLEKWNHLPAVREAQILIRTPMPCGGIADCGVCAVVNKSSWMMACKEGPVFTGSEL